jgi:uncharacterized protein YjbJ (UPF0337 family)
MLVQAFLRQQRLKRRFKMNREIVEGNWNQLKGEVQKRWGKLTNDNLDQINGNRTKLLGVIQESYGVAKEEAEKQVKDWEKSSAA